MQIHLSKPGGRKRGPYTLEQINRDLAANKYKGDDYWAWYEGQAEWVPLYSVPGVLDPESASISAGTEPAAPEAEPPQQVAAAEPALAIVETAPPEAPAPGSQVPSGMPFGALEQIFLITTGDGQLAARDSQTVVMLQETVGKDLTTIRRNVARDVIAHCEVLAQMKGKGSTPPAVWRAMASFKPDLLQHAKEGTYRICVRTFRIDSGDLVSVFLFYNKKKLQPAA